MIKKIQKNMNKKGFTLVELIIVLAVMAILATIAIPRMTGITQTFRERADLRSCETLARELEVRVQLGTLSTDQTDVLVSTIITDGSVGTPETTDGDTNDEGFYILFDASAGTLTVYVGDSNSDSTVDGAIQVNLTGVTAVN